MHFISHCCFHYTFQMRANFCTPYSYVKRGKEEIDLIYNLPKIFSMLYHVIVIQPNNYQMVDSIIQNQMRMVSYGLIEPLNYLITLSLYFIKVPIMNEILSL